MAEASMAAVIAAVATVGVLQVMVVAARQARKSEHQALILREVGNVMEDLCSRSWQELSADQPPEMELPETLRQRVPDARLEVDIRPEDDRPSTLRITVSVKSPVPSNGAIGPVQLVAWRTRFEEESR